MLQKFACISCLAEFEEECNGYESAEVHKALCRTCSARIVGEYFDNQQGVMSLIWNRIVSRKEQKDKSNDKERKRKQRVPTQASAEAHRKARCGAA